VKVVSSASEDSVEEESCEEVRERKREVLRIIFWVANAAEPRLWILFARFLLFNATLGCSMLFIDRLFLLRPSNRLIPPVGVR
jgi:hypothetical protein